MLTRGECTLVNANEEIVETLALDMMRNAGVCCCEVCVLDVCALVLNQIGSHYVTSRQGKVIGNLLSSSHENKTELLIEVTKAIERVRTYQRH